MAFYIEEEKTETRFETNPIENATGNVDVIEENRFDENEKTDEKVQDKKGNKTLVVVVVIIVIAIAVVLYLKYKKKKTTE